MQKAPMEEFDITELQNRAAALVEAAQKVGADAADAVVAASRSTGVEIRDQKLEETESAENNAFSLRVFVGDRVAAVSANLSGDPKALAERAVAMAKVAPPDPFAMLADEDRLEKSPPDLDLFDPSIVDFGVMKNLALESEEAALAVPGVSKSSGASFGRSLGGSVLATSNGFIGSYRASRFSLSVSVVAGEGTSMERDYDFSSVRYLEDLRSAAEIGTLAGGRAVDRLNPRRVDTQTATIVFDPRVAKGFIGHLAGAVNGASIVRKTSFLRDKMGKQVFAPGIKISDNPNISRGVASRPFDGEGVRAEQMNLVADGILENWLLDCSTGKELGLLTNGRANRGGSTTSPGSTNLTLHAGTRSSEDMIKDLKTGFYVTELIGQGVNLTTGDYSRGASGFWIENGQLSFAVSEVTIAGKLPEMFLELEAANDLELGFAINAPTIAIGGMTIAGR